MAKAKKVNEKEVPKKKDVTISAENLEKVQKISVEIGQHTESFHIRKAELDQIVNVINGKKELLKKLISGE